MYISGSICHQSTLCSLQYIKKQQGQAHLHMFSWGFSEVLLRRAVQPECQPGVRQMRCFKNKNVFWKKTLSCLWVFLLFVSCLPWVHDMDEDQLHPAGVATGNRQTHDVSGATWMIMIIHHLQPKENTWKNHNVYLSDRPSGYTIQTRLVRFFPTVNPHNAHQRTPPHTANCTRNHPSCASVPPPGAGRPIRWAQRRQTAGMRTKALPESSPAWCLSKEGTPCWSTGACHRRDETETGANEPSLCTSTPPEHSNMSAETTQKQKNYLSLYASPVMG